MNTLCQTGSYFIRITDFSITTLKKSPTLQCSELVEVAGLDLLLAAVVDDGDAVLDKASDVVVLSIALDDVEQRTPKHLNICCSSRVLQNHRWTGGNTPSLDIWWPK